MKGYIKIIGSLVALAAFFLLIAPLVLFAADSPRPGLVPCDNSAGDPCNFNALMEMINIIINFILFKLALPIAAIMFAWAGVLLVTAGGGEGKTKAKGIFLNTLLGFIFAVAAWIIISTVLAILGYDGSWIGLKIGI